MLESLPGLLLVLMIALTLILLPRLSEPQNNEPRRATEEIRINVKRKK